MQVYRRESLDATDSTIFSPSDAFVSMPISRTCFSSAHCCDVTCIGCLPYLDRGSHLPSEHLVSGRFIVVVVETVHKVARDRFGEGRNGAGPLSRFFGGCLFPTQRNVGGSFVVSPSTCCVMLVISITVEVGVVVF